LASEVWFYKYIETAFLAQIERNRNKDKSNHIRDGIDGPSDKPLGLEDPNAIEEEDEESLSDHQGKTPDPK
jgi:hypothetical protein